MKNIYTTQNSLVLEERWDFDYHSPAVLINKFNKKSLKKVSDVAFVVKSKRDPTRRPNDVFQYIDISSIDVETGEIARSQELTGDEAPSRARKLVKAYDILISTCRPTRKAIAVVPEELHGQICSTGFSVIRAKENINPLYLHFALRFDSTMEQFRKFSTGSSYPAILDSDVEKTLIPVPDIEIQDQIVFRLNQMLMRRNKIIQQINMEWESTIDQTVQEISTMKFNFTFKEDESRGVWSKEGIEKRILSLPELVVEDIIEENLQGEIEFAEE